MQNYFSNIIEVLAYRALNQPDEIAYKFHLEEDSQSKLHSITYSELNQQSKNIAAYLRTEKLFGERLLLIYPPGLEFISAFFGCLYSGNISVPASLPNRNQKLSHIENIIFNCEASGVLTVDRLKNKIRNRLLNFSTSLKFISTDVISYEESSNKIIKFTPKKLAFLQYTSGSTGNPKGVMVTHENIIYNSKLIYNKFEHTSKSFGVSWLPNYHDMGLIGGILQPLLGGFPVVLLSPVDFLRRPLLWLKTISKYRATTSGAPNFAYEMCADKIKLEDKGDLDLSSWDLAFIGAEPIRAETLYKFAEAFKECGFKKSAFYPCYGMAESTLMISGGVKSLFPTVSKNKGLPYDKKIVSCGRVNSSSNVNITIVDTESGEMCEEKTVGEIWVEKNDSIAIGYWNNKELSSKIFNAKISENNSFYLKTGDLGFVYKNELFVTGRIKDLIVIHGKNFYSQDIERAVDCCHPALKAHSTASFTIDIDGEERLILVQEIKRTYYRKLEIDNCLISEESYREKQILRKEIEFAARASISRKYGLNVYDIQLIKFGDLPKTSSGKVKRQLCKENYIKNVKNRNNEHNKLILISNSNDKHTQIIASEQIIEKPNDASLNLQNAEAVEQWLSLWLCNKLQIPLHKIENNRAFAEYGVDSVTAVELAQDLKELFSHSIEIEETIAWNFPDIKSLAIYLCNVRQNSFTEQQKESMEERARDFKFIERLDTATLSEEELIMELSQEIALAREKNK